MQSVQSEINWLLTNFLLKFIKTYLVIWKWRKCYSPEFHNFPFIVDSLAYNCSHHRRDSYVFLVCCQEAKWCEGSLYEGSIPASWKHAIVTPVFWSKSDTSNYRPISVLPVFAKIQERQFTKWCIISYYVITKSLREL